MVAKCYLLLHVWFVRCYEAFGQYIVIYSPTKRGQFEAVHTYARHLKISKLQSALRDTKSESRNISVSISNVDQTFEALFSASL